MYSGGGSRVPPRARHGDACISDAALHSAGAERRDAYTYMYVCIYVRIAGPSRYFGNDFARAPRNET